MAGAGGEARFAGLSLVQLNDLLEDEGQLAEMVQKMEETQNIQLSKEMTLASNRSLAEGNLLFQPRLDALKAGLTQKYQELRVLFEAYQLKKTKLASPAALPWRPCSHSFRRKEPRLRRTRSGCPEAHSQIHSPAPTAGSVLDEGSVSHSFLSDLLLPSWSFAQEEAQGGTVPDLRLLLWGLQLKVCSLRTECEFSWSQFELRFTGLCWVERLIHFKLPSEAVFPCE
ncbi:vacuolar protein sorting-associated protein 37B isoform X2 [Artibeus jamaicensis]|uniref:vacuolar protein sorting-associated protein 37B isoform X2 n=1 Tax=Artibeus jamaicensis TaxID=9417 RepID=UPI00235B15CE|nr:vacuolar protein sorting-associated protein 37B isoform X2 [Artibeus jamaicensis]